MYLQNKYSCWYYNIIDRAKSRDLSKDVYTEKHHIIPRSLGGNNKEENLVVLTAREHFICHLLLPKMCLGVHQSKMYGALWCMSMLTERQGNYKIKSHTYSAIKEAYSKSIQGRVPWNKGKIGCYEQSAESNLKRSNALKGRPSPNKGNYHDLNPFYGKKHSEETKQKIANSRLGKKYPKKSKS